MTEIKPTDTPGSKPTNCAAPTGFDLDAYLPLMDDFQMTEVQKREFLGVLCNILMHFVNMGFDLRKVDICGQLMDGFNESAAGDVDGIGLEPAQDMETRDEQEDTP